MSALSNARRTANMYQLPDIKPHFVKMARTVELCSTTHPTRQRLLMLLRMWLRTAEEHGVTRRQPEYAEALQRGIKALEDSASVAQAISLLRTQEAVFATKPSRSGDANR